MIKLVMLTVMLASYVMLASSGTREVWEYQEVVTSPTGKLTHVFCNEQLVNSVVVDEQSKLEHWSKFLNKATITFTVPRRQKPSSHPNTLMTLRRNYVSKEDPILLIFPASTPVFVSNYPAVADAKIASTTFSQLFTLLQQADEQEQVLLLQIDPYNQNKIVIYHSQKGLFYLPEILEEGSE